jgi:hypothetical protein
MTRSFAKSIAVVGALAAFAAPHASHAQRINTIKPTAPVATGTGVTIEGVIRDPDGRPLAAAEVIIDSDHRAISNSRGEFAVGGLQSGLIEFSTRRIGYTPITTAVQVDPGTLRVTLAVKLVPIIQELGTITVEGKRLSKSLWQTGFYKRQDGGRGTYFDDQYLSHHHGSIATLIGTVPSVNVDRKANGVAAAFGRLPNGAACPLSVFVDGNYIPWARDLGIDDVINRDEVLALEIYPRASEMPSRIAGLGGMSGVGSIGTVNIQGTSMQGGGTFAECGAILIWTKPLNSK